MKSKEENNIDDKFKTAFEQLHVTPPKHNWTEIEDEADTELDEGFRQKLQPLKVNPKPHVWQNIQEEVPLHPGMRRYFGWMLKVAAILVIGMLLTILSDQKRQSVAQLEKQNQQQDIEKTIHLQNTTSSKLTNLSSTKAFVFEVAPENTNRKQHRKYTSEENLEIKKLLQFILEDDDEIVAKANQDVLNKGLSTVEKLEEKTALAYHNNTTTEVVDLEIKIPLIVVENDQEADQLIQFYDSNHPNVVRLD